MDENVDVPNRSNDIEPSFTLLKVRLRGTTGVSHPHRGPGSPSLSIGEHERAVQHALELLPMVHISTCEVCSHRSLTSKVSISCYVPKFHARYIHILRSMHLETLCWLNLMETNLTRGDTSFLLLFIPVIRSPVDGRHDLSRCTIPGCPRRMRSRS